MHVLQAGFRHWDFAEEPWYAFGIHAFRPDEEPASATSVRGAKRPNRQVPGVNVLGRRALLAQGRDVAVRVLYLQEGLRPNKNAFAPGLGRPGQQAEEEAGKEKRQGKPKA